MDKEKIIMERMNEIEKQIQKHAVGVQNVYDKFNDIQKILESDELKHLMYMYEGLNAHTEIVNQLNRRMDYVESLIKNNWKYLEILRERFPNMVQNIAREMDEIFHIVENE